MPGNRDQDTIRIARVNRDLRNLLSITQPKMCPGLSGVDGFVEAIADGQIRPLQSLAAANVDDVRIGKRYRNAADRTSRLIVENRSPGAAVIGGLPHAAVYLRDVENVRLRRHPRDGARAPTTIRADAAPVKRAEQAGIELLRDGRQAAQQETKRQ